MQKQTKDSETSVSTIDALKIARQVRAIKRTVLHNVDHGITDMPAKGLLSPFGLSLHRETVNRLNNKLKDYDVQVDTYKLNIRGKEIDRIAVVKLDDSLVEPSPAYQTALQSRLTTAVS